MKRKRKDGRLVKMDPLFKIIPFIMERRFDAQVFYEQDVSLTPIDKYIADKKAQGINLGYMHIFYSAMIRTMKVKPKLNQFVMKGRLYRRNNITISMMVKKNMSLDGEETSIKLDFTGEETPEDIKNILNDLIEKEKSENQNPDDDNDMDALVKVLDKIPQGLLGLVVKFLKFLDSQNIMPHAIIKASPFHSSAFITNMGSLGIRSIYHHIYDFGTVGVFLAIGKKDKRLIMENKEVVEEKYINLKFVSDERICDGFYFSRAFKQFFKYLRNPELLDKPIGEIED